MEDNIKIKNVFVSHFHEDEDNIKGLKELLSDAYCIKNYSVTSDKFNNAKDENYIKSLLRPLINQSSSLICLIGSQTHDSKWVNWEIEQAAKEGKQIIGVYTLGAKDSDIPEALEYYADSIVGWRKEKILAALKGENHFETANGESRPILSTICSEC